jgi:hypothetical protein
MYISLGGITVKDKEKMHCASNSNKPANMEHHPVMATEEQRLEGMYPKTYLLIIPCIRKKCDSMEMKKGEMYIPEKEEMDEMIEEICSEIEEEIEEILEDHEDEEMTRQRRRRRRRRRLFRDYVGSILIGELLGRRRRRPPYFPPPYHGGYPGYPPYPGYPGY